MLGGLMKWAKEIHRDMLEDRVRTEAYQQALQQVREWR